MFAAPKRRLAARPLPSPGGSAGRTEATPRLSRTPARPGPHVHGRRRSAELSRIARGTRSQITRSTTRSPSLFHAHARVPPRPPGLCAVRTTRPLQSLPRFRGPAPGPRPPAKFSPELTGPRAGRALGQRAGSQNRGAGVARGTEGSGAPGRARSLRLWGRPGPRRSLRRSALPPAPPAR